MQDLPFHTLTQFVALGVTLIAGWFLGLATSSGGRKWRERYSELELDNAGYRDNAEHDLREGARRIRDLEAENARLRAAAPAAHGDGHSTAALAGAAIAGAAAGAVATHAADQHAYPVADHATPAHAPHGDDHAHADGHH